MKTLPRITASAIVLAIFAVFAALYLSGCTARTPGRATSRLEAHLSAAEHANAAARSDVTFIRSNLSRADGKAAVILEWFKQHRGEPQRP